MKQMIDTFLIGAFTGITGSGIGCLLGYILLKIGQKSRFSPSKDQKNLFYAMLYEFSSGLMMGIVTFHMLPEAMDTGGLLITVGGLLCGLILLYFFGKLLRKHEVFPTTGILLLIGIIIHNIPEGMAIGTATVNHFSLAVSLVTVIILHDIPEGISAFFSLHKMKLSKILLIIMIGGIPTGLAAIGGRFLGEISHSMNGVSLSFAAGAMLYIMVCELSHEAKLSAQRKLTESMYIAGLLVGILLK